MYAIDMVRAGNNAKTLTKWKAMHCLMTKINTTIEIQTELHLINLGWDSCAGYDSIADWGSTVSKTFLAKLTPPWEWNCTYALNKQKLWPSDIIRAQTTFPPIERDSILWLQLSPAFTAGAWDKIMQVWSANGKSEIPGFQGYILSFKVAVCFRS